MAQKDVEFYYHQAAFFAAFEATNSEIVIATNGSVYKDYISQETLVVDKDGNVGKAGKVEPGTINIKINTKDVNGLRYAATATVGTSENVEFSTAARWETISGGAVKNIDEWSYVALVIDNELRSMRLYVDGELAETQYLASTFDIFQTGVIDTLIGASSNAALTDFDLTGSVDDFRIYDDLIETESYITIDGEYRDDALDRVYVAAADIPQLAVGMDLMATYNGNNTITFFDTTIESINTVDNYVVISQEHQWDEITPLTIPTRFYNGDPLAGEKNAVKDMYDFGRQRLNFDEKVFIPPKGFSRARTASFKIKTTNPINVRGIAIEYIDGAIR